MPTSRRVEQIIALAALALLAIGCFFVLRPFLSAILWAIILCFSTWPLYTWLVRNTSSTTVAAVAMTMLAAAIFVLPFAVIGPGLAQDIAAVAAAVNQLLEEGPPAPPEWAKDLPLVGSSLYDYWVSAQTDSAAFATDLRVYINQATNWLLQTGVTLGQGLIEVVLSLIVAFFVYRDGRVLGRHLSTATERFVGPRAKALIDLAGATTRGVVYGILGTALAQGALAAVGFFVAGVPGALFFGLVTFFLSFIPMGPPLVWVPASIWLMSTGEYWWGAGLFLYGLGVISLIDNFLKPYFISREGKLPFLLVFLGVLGGILAFGFIGIFLGPVLLAIGFSLAKEWSTGEVDPQRPAD
jgi:predicted PurR-regulated permease PerM